MNKFIHGPNIAGQSLADRVAAARHSIAGQGLAKSVCKATTEEVMGPKKKHLDYLLQCTNEPNVSIPQLANLLIERTQNNNWVVVYKALVSIHNLMNYGNERFTQYLASNNCTFNLSAFLDKAGVQGYDMSTYIRRYAKYLNEKAYSYRTMAFDFCKVKRGKDNGLLRTMNTEKLLKSLPVLQQQVDALLEFDVTPNELTNGVINACFMLLFKDLIRLFACYNDGIINLLEKYFEMTKKNCRESLDLYKRFLVRMERTAEFLKVCESVGIDKGDIPDLAKAPSSLLEALEEHLKSLESAKKSGQPAPKPAAKVTSEISTFAAAATSGVNAAVISDEEKQRIIEEESKQLEQLKEQNLKEKSSPTGSQGGSASAAANNPFSTGQSQQSVDLFGTGSPTHAANANRPSDDLLNLGGGSASNPFAPVSSQSNNPFASAAPASNTPPGGAQWGQQPIQGSNAPQQNAPLQNGNSFTTEAHFDRAFGNRPQQQQGAGGTTAFPPPLQPSNALQQSNHGGAASGTSAFDGFGDILQPNNQPTGKAQPDNKLISRDLDTSLASLAGNLSINPSQQVKKTDHQWNQSNTNSAERKMTGGTGTAWSGAPPYNQAMGGMLGKQSRSTGSLDNLMNQYHTQSGLQTPIVSQNPAHYSWGVPAMGAMPVAGQPGFQQPGMMGYQQPMGMGMPPRQPMAMGMGMGGQPAPGMPMFQQPMGQQPAQSGSLTGQSSASQPNDPFGSL